MLDRVGKKAAARALLTDTLPYEVPVIFSNDRLYASLIAHDTALSTKAKSFVQRIQNITSSVTKPYSYSIMKDRSRYTTLGIIHPSTQIIIASFYEAFSASLLSSCGSGEVSLRRPIGHTPLFSEAELNGDRTFKLGIPHIDPDEGDSDISHVVSYFSYGKYNLLGKFVESEEFKRLEKRFRILQTSDITRCFASIYTHSVAWAVKGKEFSKRVKSSFSFEGKFDEIMQFANYGETNGIVIGPEISRIFAEIILQSVDRSVLNELRPLQNNRDFAIRRYVDDYFIFANSSDTSEMIMDSVVRNLEKYKLYPNTTKTKLSMRPFVSGISLARSEISLVIGEIYVVADDVFGSTDPGTIAAKGRLLRNKATAMRQACSKHGVELHVVSGWVLTNLRNVLSKLVRKANDCDHTLSSAIYGCLSAILDIIFYICAVDLRVRTTYALCQCLYIVSEIRNCGSTDLIDRTNHFLSEEMSILIRNAMTFGDDVALGVEMANLLISGYHYIGPGFLRNDVAREALNRMANADKLTYFQYIVVKFCCRREPALESLLNVVNQKAIDLIGKGSDKIALDAEAYLIFCDYLSSTDTTLKAKRALIKNTIGGNPSDTILEEVIKAVGFVDWDGTAIQHTLERKALRPVYTWS